MLQTFPPLGIREKEFLDFVTRLHQRRAGKVAVIIRLSCLSRAYSRDHHIRLATEMFSNAVAPLEGSLFALQNHDLIFVSSNAPLPALNEAVMRMRVLFAKDPLLTSPETEHEAFCTWYRLENQFDELLSDARKWVEEADCRRNDLSASIVPQRLMPMTPFLLSQIETSLRNVDIAPVVRHQTIWTMIPKQDPIALFDEIYVSIADLQKSVTPGVDWLANPLLFSYLTQSLDRRVMAFLLKRGVPGFPFSINLNIETVLSTEFRRFDETISSLLRGRLVVEFSKLDVFKDMGAFLFARDYLHERGFRVCLDGLTHLTLPYYDRRRLEFDLIKLFWGPDGLEEMLPQSAASLREIILTAGQARTILCRCENERAYQLGRDLGIVMFQGRYPDHICHAFKQQDRWP